jgi:hypothetical protein
VPPRSPAVCCCCTMPNTQCCLPAVIATITAQKRCRLMQWLGHDYYLDSHCLLPHAQRPLLPDGALPATSLNAA